MISAVFYTHNGHFTGFTVSGHAGGGEYGHDILCAGVSSAVMLTINTLTDFLSVDSKARVFGGKAGIKINTPCEQSDAVIFSLETHLKLLARNSKNGAVSVVRKTYFKKGSR